MISAFICYYLMQSIFVNQLSAGKNQLKMKVLEAESPEDIIFNPDGIFATYDTPIWKTNSMLGLVRLDSREIFEKTVRINPGMRKKSNRFVNPRRPHFSIIDAVYPQLLLVVDKSLLDKFSSVEKAVQYVLATWNHVDTNFRFFEKPKIRLNIAGIVLALDAELPYISFNRLKTSGEVNVGEALKSSESFWKSQMIEKFDIIITMTSNNLVEQKGNHQLVNTKGKLNFNGMCYRGLHNRRQSSLIFHDSGKNENFVELIVEFARAFEVDLNEMMCTINLRVDSGLKLARQLTNCTLSGFNNFFYGSANSSCLSNKPESSGMELPRYLPGLLLNADEQCWDLGFAGSTEISGSKCHLGCHYLNKAYYEEFQALIGTPCDKNSTCVYGQCILTD